jgi:hypothetical protein
MVYVAAEALAGDGMLLNAPALDGVRSGHGHPSGRWERAPGDGQVFG